MNDSKDNTFSKNKFDIAKGICALVIVVHHCAYYFRMSWFSVWMTQIGYLPVGLFFFMSGYGLIFSLYNKENYLKSFLQKRVGKLLIPTLLMLIVYVGYDLALGLPCSGNDFLNGSCNFGHFWYICVNIFFYILFYVSFKHLSLKCGVIVTLFELLVYILVSHFLSLGSYWYFTTLAYWIGLFIGYLYLKNRRIYISAHKKHFLIGLLFSLMFLITTYLKFNRVRLGIDFPGMGVGLTLISSGLLPLALFFLLAKYNPTNCIKMISDISLYLYLTHNLMISILKGIIIYNNLVGLISVLITSFGAAYMLKTLTAAIYIYWEKGGLNINAK